MDELTKKLRRKIEERLRHDEKSIYTVARLLNITLPEVKSEDGHSHDKA